MICSRLAELAGIWFVDAAQDREQGGDADAFDETRQDQRQAERNLPPKTVLSEHPEGIGEGRGAEDFVFGVI